MAKIAVLCSVCAEVAARFAALGAGEGTGIGTRDARLERTGWFGTCLRPMPLAQAEAWIVRIGSEPLAALADEEQDLFGFVCGECGVAYCGRCWDIGPPLFDEGFYDCTRGTCPKGHEQTLDD
jgi:hypothetical protein